MITITANASQQIKSIAKNENKPGAKLRIKIIGGGCNGFSYDFDLCETSNNDDTIIDDIIIDSESVEYLKGSTVDFHKKLIGSMFVIDNPNTQSSCGCGISFDLKE